MARNVAWARLSSALWMAAYCAAADVQPALAQPARATSTPASPAATSTPAPGRPPARPAADAGDTPWSKGVTPAARAAARTQLEAGNQLFVDKRYKEALAAYEQALGQWDHPAIHFNAARACIALDRTVDALDHLEKALAFGEAPYDAATHREATTYQKLLLGQLATAKVRCKQTGVAVTLNGEALLTCPGEQELRVKPGRHALVGTKAGYIPRVVNATLVPGTNDDLLVELAPIGSDRESKIVTRWASWKPWTVVATGVVVTAVGTAALFQSRELFVDYRDRLQDECSITACAEDPFPDLRSRAENTQSGGVALMIGGGAVLAAGVTMAILNAPRKVFVERAPAKAERSGPRDAWRATPLRDGAIVQWARTF